MVATCGSCGAANTSDSRFCNQCGVALLDTAAAILDPGERRLVTALFADLVGFTGFTAAHDAEDVRAMLVRWFDRARETVEGLGGVIDKYTGDAVTAFWGARVAREDDAERAVRAGLRLVDAAASLGRELGIDDLRLRVGIATGETSVGAGGNLTGLVVGDLVNVAARVQPLAEPGTVVVAGSTRALAHHAVDFESVGSHHLKGVPEAVEIHRAIALTVGTVQRGGPEPPFVGRAAELGLLEDHHRATADESRARLVSIVGEPGIGKTRLAAEAERRIGSAHAWYVGRSTTHRDGSTFSALADIVRQLAEVPDGADDAPARLAAAVDVLTSDEDERRWMTARLAAVLDVEPLPGTARDDLFGGLRLFLQHHASAGPLTLVFDELQWADESLLDFLIDLVERSKRHPILVVTLARPDLLERHPDWGAAHHRFTSVHLGPVADADVARLVAGMAPGIDDATVDLIVGAAAGVPLYAVEYVRMLIGTGGLLADGDRFRQVETVDSLEMPESLQAVVGARFDRLPAEDRSLIQDAAVLGDLFPRRHLEMVTQLGAGDLDVGIERLVREGILEVDSDIRGTVTIRFVQSTIRELASRRLSREELHRRHMAVVDGLDLSDSSEVAGVVAAHCLAALEARPDPALFERAADSLLAAARRAADLHAVQQALDLVERAVRFAGDDAARLPFWEVGADAASAARDHDLAEELARRVLERRLSGADPDAILGARARLTRVLEVADRSEAAIGEAAEHFDAARGGEPAMAELGRVLAGSHISVGDFGAGAAIARDLLVTSADVGDPILTVSLLQLRSMALHGLGRTQEAAALVREAVRIASQLDTPAIEARALSTLIYVEGRDGRLRDLEAPQRLLGVAALAAEPPIEKRAAAWVARIQTAMGRYREARDLYASSQEWNVRLRADERYDRSRIRYLEWILDADPAALDDAESLIGTPDDASAEGSSIVLSARAQYAYARGDAESAYDLAMRADPAVAVPHSFIYDLPMFAALRLGDLARFDAARARIPTSAGRRFASLRRLGDAGIELLGHPSSDTAAAFIAAAEWHGTVDGPGDEAQLLAVLGCLLPDDPEARAAAVRAKTWFADHGAAGYTALYSDCWGG